MNILATEYLDYPQRLELKELWYGQMPDYVVTQGFQSTHMIFFQKQYQTLFRMFITSYCPVGISPRRRNPEEAL